MYGFRHERIDKSQRYHGVDKENSTYYIKELEFRYNERENLEKAVIEVLGGM